MGSRFLARRRRGRRLATASSAEPAAGSEPAVGGWDPSQAAGPGPVTVALPAGGVVALKTLKQNEDGRPVWSAHPDHFVVVEDFAEGETVTVGH